MLAELLSQFADSVSGSVAQERFQTQIALARSQTEETSPLKIDTWIKEFIAS